MGFRFVDSRLSPIPISPASSHVPFSCEPDPSSLETMCLVRRWPLGRIILIIRTSVVCARRLLELDTFWLVAINVLAVLVRLLAIRWCVVPSWGLTTRWRLGGILGRRVWGRGESHPASSIHGLRPLDAAAAGISTSTAM